MSTSKKRSNSGKFETISTPDDDGDKTSTFTFNVPRAWIYKLTVLMVLFLLMSPWLFLVFRNNGFSVLSRKVAAFYDSNFSCPTLVDGVDGVDREEKKKYF